MRGRLAAASVCGVVAVAAVTVVLRQLLTLGPSYPWKAAAVFAATGALATVTVVRSHPFPSVGPANLVTLARAGLLAFLVGFLGEPATPSIAWTSIVLGTLIAVLDGVDGWVARRSRMTSRFGAAFDMETDALFILVLSTLVWQHAKAGSWVLLGGLLRYVFASARWVVPWMGRPLTPTLRGKTMAVVHMVGLLVALGPIIPVPLSTIAAALTLAGLMWSFAVDAGRLRRSVS